MSEASGRCRMVVSPRQVPDPLASAEIRLMTHVLVAGWLMLGIGSGGPKRHPALWSGYSVLVTDGPEVHWRSPGPASVGVVAARSYVPVPLLQLLTLKMETPRSGTAAGSGTPTPPPPK